MSRLGHDRRRALVSELTVWGGRLAWLGVAVFGGRAVGAAASGRSGAVETVATVGAWAGWAAGAVALAVPAVVTLTAVRAIVPAALVVLAVAVVFGADADDALALGVPAVVAAVLVAAAETGRLYIQASAYGDEQRFGLRPPLGYLTAVVATWMIWVTAVIIAPLAWAAAAWVPAVVASVVVVAGALTLPRRWHQLSRRWLVFVPAGLVVHDPVVLADTLMLPRRTVAAVEANELGPGTATTAVDLTGPTPGLAVEITLRQSVTAVLAQRPTEPRGRPVQCAAVLVSPTRPGAVLTEARRRLNPSRR